MRVEQAPMLPIVGAVALGVWLAPWVGVPSRHLIGLCAVLLAAAAVALSWRGERVAIALLLAGLAVIGALRARAPLVPADHIARQAVSSPVALEGRIASEPIRWAPDRQRLLVDVEAYRDGPGRRPASGRVQLAIYGETPPLGEAQRVSADVRLHRPVGYRNPGAFDYTAQLRRQGILLVGSGRGDRVVPLGPDVPPWPVRVKRWAVQAIRSGLPEGSAALLAGLVLGERTALPPEVDEAFRRAGVYHVLAVSGFNVALLASAVFAALGLAGVPRRATALVAALVLVGFALVVGGQPSVVRATVMGLLLLGSVLLERESQVMNALALAALALLLWRPADLRDPGFVLSFAATGGIIYLAPSVGARLTGRGWPPWLAAALAVSAAAQLAVTPVMLTFFNQLSLIGVLANLFVVPLAAPATMLGLLAVAVSPVSDALAGLLFHAVWLVLVALRAVVWLAARVPAAMVHLPAPDWAAVAAWYGALALWPRLGGHRAIGRAMAGLLLVALALSVRPWVAPGDGRLRVMFLDVGQGDATLIETPDGHRILVDGGAGGPRRFDVGERVLAPVLWNRPAVRLDVMALTHPDVDHAGGLAALVRRFGVGEFWESGRWTPPAEHTRLALHRAGTPRRVLRAGDRIRLGEALFTVLNPGGPGQGSPNDDSLVLRLDWRGVSLLMPGDLGAAGEERLRRAAAPLHARVLKVAHHGSRFSTTGPFLAAVRPAVAVISVGARNPFRHPAPEVISRLEAVGALVYRTDRDGAVIVESDGATLWVTRWAPGTTDVVPLAGDSPEDTTAPGNAPGAAVGRATAGGSGPEGSFVVGPQPLQLLGIETHAEGEPHLSQDGLDLVERLLAEVLRLEQLRLRALHQVGDAADVGRLEAVGRPHGQLELVHAPEQVLVEVRAHHRLDPGLRPLRLDGQALHEGRHQAELIFEDPRGLADGRLGRHAAVRPHLEDQPLVGRGVAAEALDVEVGPLHRDEVGVDQHGVDRQRLGLPLLRRLVATPALQADLHLERAVLVQAGQHHVGRQDLHVGVGLEVAGHDRARSLRLEAQQLGPVHVQGEDELAEVHDDVEGVLGHALHVGELVEDALDLHPCGGRAGDRREEHPPIRVARGERQARLERLDGDLAVGTLPHEPFVTGG
jgi:competence protein ComEC